LTPLRPELDAYYARLCGFTRKQLRYILDPADLTRRELDDILDPFEEIDDPLDEEGCRHAAKPPTSPARPSASSSAKRSSCTGNTVRDGLRRRRGSGWKGPSSNK